MGYNLYRSATLMDLRTWHSNIHPFWLCLVLRPGHSRMCLDHGTLAGFSGSLSCWLLSDLRLRIQNCLLYFTTLLSYTSNAILRTGLWWKKILENPNILIHFVHSILSVHLWTLDSHKIEQGRLCVTKNQFDTHHTRHMVIRDNVRTFSLHEKSILRINGNIIYPSW